MTKLEPVRADGARTTFRQRLAAARPEVAETFERNHAKVDLARALRALRKAKGLTQKDVERLSGLRQSSISRLESPSGPIPGLDTVMRYVDACGGGLVMGFSAEANSGKALKALALGGRSALVSAIAF